METFHRLHPSAFLFSVLRSDRISSLHTVSCNVYLTVISAQIDILSCHNEDENEDEGVVGQ